MCASTNAQEHLIAAIAGCHNMPVDSPCGLNEISGGFSSVVEAAIYKGGSDNRQTSFREP
jgi:hypothetical protein